MASSTEIPYREFAPAMRGMMQVHSAVDASPVPRAVIALVRLRASQMNGCSYCVQVHWAEARDHGVPDDKLALLATWHSAPWFTAGERAALQMTEALTTLAARDAVDRAVQVASEEFDPEELAALLMAVAEINAWNRLAVGGGRHAR